MRTAARLSMIFAVLWLGASQATASERPDLRQWYATMQEATSRNAAAFYGAASGGATAVERADADWKVFRRRTLEVGGELTIDEGELRQQIRTSDNSTYLLTWRRGKTGWQIETTEPLTNWLYLHKSSPDLLWPPHANPESPVDVLIRLARMVHTDRPSEAAIAREFGTVGGHTGELNSLVDTIAEWRVIPMVSGRSLSDRAWICSVRVDRSEYDISMEQVDGVWRVKAVSLKPEPVLIGLSADDATQIRRLMDATEKAFLSGDSEFLLKHGVDASWAQARLFTPEGSKARLTTWRRAVPSFKARFKTEDLIGIPLQGRLNILFSDAADVVLGSVWVARFGGSWRLVELYVSSMEIETIKVPRIQAK